MRRAQPTETSTGSAAEEWLNHIHLRKSLAAVGWWGVGVEVRQGVSGLEAEEQWGVGGSCTEWLWEGGEGMQMGRQENQQFSVTHGRGREGEGGQDDPQGLPLEPGRKRSYLRGRKLRSRVRRSEKKVDLGSGWGRRNALRRSVQKLQLACG